MSSQEFRQYKREERAYDKVITKCANGIRNGDYELKDLIGLTPLELELRFGSIDLKVNTRLGWDTYFGRSGRLTREEFNRQREEWIDIIKRERADI